MLTIALHVLSKIFVPAFLIGMAGSAVVVLVTVIKDIREFRSDDVLPEPAQDKLKVPATTA